MVQRPKTPPTAAPNDKAEQPLNPTRRRWLQAGLSAPPVLMTVVSRPVLAQVCVPPSAYVSIGTSAPGMAGACTGFGPGHWAAYESNPWPSGYYPVKVTGSGGDNQNATEFYKTFAKESPPYFVGNDFSTLLDVLKNAKTGPKDQVGRYVVAALLNNAANLNTNVLSAAVIQHIWSEFAATGHFTPMPGASWGAAEIVDYLNSTMPNP